MSTGLIILIAYLIVAAIHVIRSYKLIEGSYILRQFVFFRKKLYIVQFALLLGVFWSVYVMCKLWNME